MNNLSIDNAIGLILKWHAGQVRKGDGSPYIIHPVAVGTILAKNNFSDEIISAGFCHDLLEDTECPEQEIVNACGEKVLEIVKAVTNDGKLSDEKDWEKKKLKYINSVRIGPVAAKAVCIADKIHNLRSLLAAYKIQGPKMWGKFNRGKKQKVWFEKLVLKMLQDSWKHPLIDEYQKLIAIEEALE